MSNTTTYTIDQLIAIDLRITEQEYTIMQHLYSHFMNTRTYLTAPELAEALQCTLESIKPAIQVLQLRSLLTLRNSSRLVCNSKWNAYFK